MILGKGQAALVCLQERYRCLCGAKEVLTPS